jgi:transposase-like protein
MGDLMTNPKKRPPLTDAERARAVERMQNGDSYAEIAADIGCAVRTVREIATKAGLHKPRASSPRSGAPKHYDKSKPAAAKPVIRPNIYVSDVISAIPLSRLMAGK